MMMLIERLLLVIARNEDVNFIRCDGTVICNEFKSQQVSWLYCINNCFLYCTALISLCPSMVLFFNFSHVVSSYGFLIGVLHNGKRIFVIKNFLVGDHDLKQC